MTTSTIGTRAALQYFPPELEALAWDLTSFEPGLDADDREALVLLVLACLLAQARGSTRVAFEGETARAQLLATLVALGDPHLDHGAVLDRLAAIVKQDLAPAIVGRDADAYTPLVFVDGHVYVQRLLFLERRIAARLKGRTTAATEVDVDDVQKNSPIPLSDEQAAAVAHAVVAPLTIVSGGPGTGKTTIVVALLDALRRAGTPLERVALAAPTGKAANRLRESIERSLPGESPPEPRTLHRLLGFAPRTRTFRYHENDPLPADVVIVDEGSMIDLALMERLLSALGDDTRLVLLGDADQLPSVEAGAVFRDVAEARRAVRLTKSFRVDASDAAGEAIVRFAAGVNDGVVAADVSAGVERVSITNDGGLPAFLDKWFARAFTNETLRHRTDRPYPFIDGAFRDDDLVDVEAVFSAHAERRLLCVTREATQPTGARAVNDAMRRRFAIARGVFDDGTYQPGEPILMLRNDYDRGLFNGDQGVVLQVGIDGDIVRPAAVFRTSVGFEAFPLVQVEHRIERAYAMTVHKAQGSEANHVALILPRLDVPLLTREIVYTAVTRARRSVTIAGHPDLLQRAVGRTLERDSGLAERLA